MKKHFGLIAILTMLFACSQNSSTPVILTELSRDTLLLIKTTKTYPTTLKVNIKGYASDTFIIAGLKVPGGNVDTLWHTDWYTKTITLNYLAYKAKQGQLTINSVLY